MKLKIVWEIVCNFAKKNVGSVPDSEELAGLTLKGWRMEVHSFSVSLKNKECGKLYMSEVIKHK